ncbi:Crp/Fnr family transcriptional regulator [Caldimonas sp. KR1-144]|uniref:Crp/Fnr family transcriptional regulator n=1 Tax=Caldimonas sp. KR1-144 TaxID=3400911 RepID=UPI003C0CC5AB
MTDEPTSAFLAASPWATALSPEQLRRVRNEATTSRFAAGATVCVRNSPAQHWLGVAEGMLKLETIASDGRTTTFAGVPSGAWFGEGAVLKGEPRPYSVIAIRDSVVVFVPRQVFLELLEGSQAFSRWLIDQLNARLAHYVALVENFRLNDSTARVAYCLSELFNPQLYPNTSPKLAISQSDIARLSGLSRQITNRSLQELQESGLIRVGYGRVEVLDLARLQRAAQTG